MLRFIRDALLVAFAMGNKFDPGGVAAFSLIQPLKPSTRSVSMTGKLKRSTPTKLRSTRESSRSLEEESYTYKSGSALEYERNFRRARFAGIVAGVTLWTMAAILEASVATESAPYSTLLPLLPPAISLTVVGVRSISVRAPSPPLGLGDGVEVREAKGKGVGLFATRPLKKGTYLFDYLGEVLTEVELHRRYGESVTKSGVVVTDYTARLTGPLGVEEPIYMDARDPDLSNVARFMNHAPKGAPNWNVERCRQRWDLGAAWPFGSSGSPLAATKGRALRFFVTRDVQSGEELSWDYGTRYWVGRENEMI